MAQNGHQPQTSTELTQALLFLFRCQTEEEKELSATVHRNGLGFAAIDAEILSSFARQVLSGRTLSDKQLNVLKLRMAKYHGQLDGGEWSTITLPEPRMRTVEKPTHAGDLLLRINHRGEPYLAFKPNVYPSKQITKLGFTTWKNGEWLQQRPQVAQHVVDSVIKLFGPDVQVAEEVTSHIQANKTQVIIDEQALLSKGLKPYQIETVKFQLEAKHALVGLAPRLGKTVSTIHAVLAAGCSRVLIVAPFTLLRDWSNKLKYWTGDPGSIVYKRNLIDPSARWSITNYDTLRLHHEKFERENWDAIIVDESLLVKNRKAKRTDVVTQLVTITKPQYLWLLSGAPTSRYLDDLWAQLHMLDPKRFSSYWRFVETYCQVEANQYSAYNIVGNQLGAEKRVQQDLADVYFSRSQADVTDMPESVIDDLEIEMDDYQDRMYGTMEDEFYAAISDDENILAPNVLSQLVRLVQIASNPILIEGKDASNKWEAVLELLQYEQLPAILWTAFIPTAKIMHQRLLEKGYTTAMLTGATPMNERDRIVQEFQQGKIQVLVAHPAVGKFGLDLWMAKTVIYLERTHNSDDYYQSLQRTRHINMQEAAHVIHLLSVRSQKSGSGKTIDHTIGMILQSRKNSVHRLTGRDLKQLKEQGQ